MEVTALKQAYDMLLAVANHERFGDPAEGEWSAGRIVAHVIATNRMIAAGAAELLAGRTPVLDNRPTQSTAYLDAIIAAAEPWPVLLRAADQSCREVLALAQLLEEMHLQVKVPAIFIDSGRIRVERPIPFQAVVGTAHLDGHADHLRALLG